MMSVWATFRRFIPAAFLLGVAAVAAASDWPRFRGPNGTGISTDKNVPVEIGPEKNLQWRVAIPGLGNSSPIVVDGRIYLQSASEDAKERRLLSLDLKSGDLLWQQFAAGETARIHNKNTLASCTAAADGKRVFMPFWNGKEVSIAAYGTDGKQLWERLLGTLSTQHGAGHSPIVVDNKVIMAFDQDKSAEVVALDADTGADVWRKPRPSKNACYSTPMLLERPGQPRVVVVINTMGVSGYDPEDGAERWKWNWTSNDKSLRTVGSPTICGGMVMLTGGNGPGDRHAVAVRLDDKGGELEFDGHLVWQTRKLFPYVPSMLVKGEHLLFVNDYGIAGCAVAATGEIVWQERLNGGSVCASPIMVEDRVYSVSESGAVTVFAADTTAYKPIATAELGEEVRATPAVADSRLLIRGKHSLFCFGSSDGGR